jgi:uncharacterized phage protein (TIGR01671 family)
MKQREIKFRIWDKLEEKFIYSDKGYQGHYILTLSGKFHNLQNGSGGEECIIQQFINVQDKNKKDIYEGDIITFDEYPNNIFVIGWSVYEEVGWSLFVKNINASPSLYEPLAYTFNGIELYDEYLVSYFDHNGYTVIGNIFENHELIK